MDLLKKPFFSSSLEQLWIVGFSPMSKRWGTSNLPILSTHNLYTKNQSIHDEFDAPVAESVLSQGFETRYFCHLRTNNVYILTPPSLSTYIKLFKAPSWRYYLASALLQTTCTLNLRRPNFSSSPWNLWRCKQPLGFSRECDYRVFPS